MAVTGFMQTLNILGVYLTHLQKTTLNFQRTKSADFEDIVPFHHRPTPEFARRAKWWAQMDLNHRPRAYQARALTN